jgi:hypothetical protein
MMLATPLGSGVQLAYLATRFKARIVDTVYKVIGDMPQHTAQLGFAANTVQLGCPDSLYMAAAHLVAELSILVQPSRHSKAALFHRLRT